MPLAREIGKQANTEKFGMVKCVYKCNLRTICITRVFKQYLQ